MTILESYIFFLLCMGFFSTCGLLGLAVGYIVDKIIYKSKEK